MTFPDFARPRWRLAAMALLVTVVVGLVLGFQEAKGLGGALGDTDDAMRLVLVRELLNGQGWWSQHLMRLQPPVGVYMHWSRLLDGGIAAMEWVFALFAPTRAEWLTRLIWPILWIFPAALAVLSLADRLGERAQREPAESGGARTAAQLGAVPVCAFFLLTNVILYLQFHPGRVDHHDVQMTCCFLALAGAVRQGHGVRGPILAGVATGLGLAIGLEALVFEAAIGAALALRFVLDEADARPLRAYGLSLAGATLLTFCIQTPPWRWTVAACDALAFNSTAAVVVAGLAVTAASVLARKHNATLRFAVLGVGAVLTALTYVLLDRNCLRGPFADVDPAIKGFWLVHVKEMRPWTVLLNEDVISAANLAAGPLIGCLGLLWLAQRRAVRQDPAYRLTAALLLMTMIAGFSGVRMWGYADWIAMAVISVACADIANVLAKEFKISVVVTLLAATLVADPVSIAHAAAALDKTLTNKPGAHKSGAAKPAPYAGPDPCLGTAPYRPLAAIRPAGLVLSEIDLGPFVLAGSEDSVLAAPYHRMSWGMVAARGALSADADHGAEAKTRALGVTYVLECRAHGRHSDRDGMAAGSLQRRLDRDQPPSWLSRISAPNPVLDIYRVKPAGPPPSGGPAPAAARTASAPAAR
jgi:hypothetical protein